MSPKQRFLDFLNTRGWARIGAGEWYELRQHFAERSKPCLRAWLRDSGADVEPPYSGIDAKTFDGLERSLTEIAGVYVNDPARRPLCRAIVIQAKDRARFAANNICASPEKRAIKEEMLQWMLVWLGDPALFEDWVLLRKNAIR